MPVTRDLTYSVTPIDALTPHARNPRNGDTDRIAESLAANGQYRPIVVARGGVILAGNHTYAAAMQLGWTDLATVNVDLDPYSPEALQIMLADNRTADLGQYDDGLLLELLRDAPLVGTGYTDDDLSDLEALLAYQTRAALGADVHDSRGGESAALGTGQAIEIAQDGRLTHYASLDTRTLILPYPVEAFAQMTELLARARAKAGADSNAEAVHLAVLAYLGEDADA